MKMIRVYVAAALAAAIFLSYIAGAHIGKVRCNAHVAKVTAKQIAINTDISRKTNEVVLHTGNSDVRRILREKYTIAE